jgi:hypothetical protein
VPNGRARALFDRQLERVVGAVGIEGEARHALAQTASELSTALLAPWRLGSTRSAVLDATRRGLDRIATLVARLPAPVDDLATLEQRAAQVRRGVATTLTVLQGLLVTSTAATDGVSGLPAIVVNAGIAQVASIITGLAEWYLVGSYAAHLMRRAGIEPNGHDLRPVVNAALLSRDAPEAEGRLIARWIGRGVLEAVPFLSAYPSQRVRRAGERLEATDPLLWPRRSGGARPLQLPRGADPPRAV